MATLTAIPTLAGAQSKLDAARHRLEAARRELTSVTGEWQETESRLAEALDAVADARTKIDGLETDLARIRASLNARVAAAFMSGGSRSIGALLTSDSIEDATDRLQYTQSVVQGDADLATQVSVMAEELRRQRVRLRESARSEAVASEELATHRANLLSRLDDLEDLVDDLKAALDARQEITLGLGEVNVLVRTGAIQTCPVAGPNSFVDSFGDPRPGGRSHAGTDLMAAPGTPIVAVAPGNARSAGSIGGLGAVVEHANGDWTFYAHLSSYGNLGAVSAGTVIGYNGDHLHFEYHPNGGGPVNPYSMLLAVC
ncbi:MAG TPA: peptidoglycan DD-metalloendopeptidase family protein [Actinomycetota bacterium]|nr:peptidoglycan DD-metalloendopeptidase family protein [Actinomycetota bacterium]